MAHHHGAHTRIHRGLKRNKLDSIQTLASNVDLRQSAMRIDCGVAVSRKVFRSRDGAGGLRAFRERCGKASDIRRIFAIRAHVDHRIRGVVVHVNNRREDLLHSERACFACSYLALAPRVFRIAGRADCHVPREINRVVKPHARSGLEIRRDEQRITRQLLHAVDENHRFINWTTKKYDAADLVIFDVMLERAIRVGILI